MRHAPGRMALPEIVEQKSEELALLYGRRERALRSLDHTLGDLALLDGRIAAHLEGLSAAGEEAWVACSTAMAVGEPGELFAAAALALGARDMKKIEQVLSCAEQHPEGMDGVVAALGWTCATRLQGTVKWMLDSSSPTRRHLGLTACAAHRVLPSVQLQAALADETAQVRASALRACGELGATQFRPSVKQGLHDPEPACRYWAAWSAILLGDRIAAPHALLEAAGPQGAATDAAVESALAALPAPAATDIIVAWSGDPAQQRGAAVGIAAACNPLHVPRLIRLMGLERHSRIAGQSMSLICGLNVAKAGFDDGHRQRVADEHPEPPDDGEAPEDPDEDLPWPHVDRIKTWWDRNEASLLQHERCFSGNDLSPRRCIETLQHGSLRHRHAAAFHLALMKPGSVLFNHGAPAWRQQQRLREHHLWLR